jgi:hypothetical protein
MFMGDPSARQKKLFDAMMTAQDAALEAAGPGVKCADVDRAELHERHSRRKRSFIWFAITRVMLLVWRAMRDPSLTLARRKFLSLE